MGSREKLTLITVPMPGKPAKLAKLTRPKLFGRMYFGNELPEQCSIA